MNKITWVFVTVVVLGVETAMLTIGTPDYTAHLVNGVFLVVYVIATLLLGPWSSEPLFLNEVEET